MLGSRKAKNQSETELSYHGWREGPLKSLVSRLVGEHPNINLAVTGFEQMIRLNGDDYRVALTHRRSDIEAYEKLAMAFDERPGPEDDLGLAATENKLVGCLRYPGARAEGTFSVATGEALMALQSGEVGHLSLSSLGGLGQPYRPLVDFHFHVRSESEEAAFCESLRSSLGRGGTAWINFIVQPIEDAATEIEKIKERGYSSRIAIRAAYFGSQVGVGPFD